MSQPINPPNQCNNCGGKHWTSREVAACAQFGNPNTWKPRPAFEPTTERQVWYIRDILKRSEEEVLYAVSLGKVKCSEYITDLKAGRGHLHPPGQVMAASAVSAPPPANNVWKLKTPQIMVENVLKGDKKQGRYAVRHDENEGYRFIRLTKPSSGRKRGCLVIQTQHSDAFKDRVIIWPSGSVTTLDTNIDPYLLLVVADPHTASRRYGQEKGVCCQCGKQLTDRRSIHYGIGPECEKHNEEIVMQVDDENDGMTYEDLDRRGMLK